MGFHSKTISFLCALNISLWWPTARLTSGSWGMENNYPSMLTPPAWGPSQTKCTVLYLPQKHLAASVYLPQKHLAASVSTYHRNTLLPVCLPTAEMWCIFLPQKHLAASVSTYCKNTLLPVNIPTQKHLAASKYTYHRNTLLPVNIPTTETPCCQ